MAVSKVAFSPDCVSALFSAYVTAPSSLASACEFINLEQRHGAHHALFLRDRCHVAFAQAVESVLVVSEVNLSADKDPGSAGHVMLHLRPPLLLDIGEGCRRNDRKAHEEHVSGGVGEWAKAVIVLLPIRVSASTTMQTRDTNNLGTSNSMANSPSTLRKKKKKRGPATIDRKRSPDQPYPRGRD